MLEKELKYELSKTHYARLKRALRKQTRNEFRLQNYYFDDSSLRLRKKRYALRIRIVDGKHFYFTLKYPAKSVSKKGPRSFKVRVEHEVRIPRKLAESILNEDRPIQDLNLRPMRILKRIFPKSVLAKVGPLGLVECKRTVVPVEKGVELEIDRCKIYNKRFYEVEVETPHPVKVDKAVKALLKSHRIPYQPVARSKFARFVQEWKKRQ